MGTLALDNLPFVGPCTVVCQRLGCTTRITTSTACSAAHWRVASPTPPSCLSMSPSAVRRCVTPPAAPAPTRTRLRRVARFFFGVCSPLAGGARVAFVGCAGGCGTRKPSACVSYRLRCCVISRFRAGAPAVVPCLGSISHAVSVCALRVATTRFGNVGDAQCWCAWGVPVPLPAR